MFQTPTAESKERNQAEQTAVVPKPRIGPAFAIGAHVGNQAILRRLSPAPSSMQRKLEIGAVNDPLEAEADQVADRVMRMPDSEVAVSSANSQVSRKCAACEEEAHRRSECRRRCAAARA